MIIGILMTMIEHFGPVYGQPGKQHEPRLQGHVLKKRLKMANIWLKANDFWQGTSQSKQSIWEDKGVERIADLTVSYLDIKRLGDTATQ